MEFVDDCSGGYIQLSEKIAKENNIIEKTGYQDVYEMLESKKQNYNGFDMASNFRPQYDMGFTISTKDTEVCFGKRHQGEDYLLWLEEINEEFGIELEEDTIEELPYFANDSFFIVDEGKDGNIVVYFETPSINEFLDFYDMSTTVDFKSKLISVCGEEKALEVMQFLYNKVKPYYSKIESLNGTYDYFYVESWC